MTDKQLVTGLPWTDGRGFRSLDEYLLYLRRGAAIDKPWYKEISPGVYQLQRAGNFRPLEPVAENEPITRAALAEKLGFRE